MRANGQEFGLQVADGSYDVVDVEPLVQGVSRRWTSPATGQIYPTRWHVRIPALHSEP